MGNIRLSLVVLRSADIERAANSYDCLGLHFEKHRHGNGTEHFSAELPGGVFELYPLSERALATSAARIGFSVTDMSAAMKALAKYAHALIKPAQESEWGLRAVAADPVGLKLELLQSW